MLHICTTVSSPGVKTLLRSSGQPAAPAAFTALQPHWTTLRISRQMAAQAAFACMLSTGILCTSLVNWLHSLTCSPTGPLCTSPPTDYRGIHLAVAVGPCRLPPDLLASHHMDSAQHWKPFSPNPQRSIHSRWATNTGSLNIYVPFTSSASQFASSHKPSSLQGGDMGTPTYVCHTLQVALPPDRTVSWCQSHCSSLCQIVMYCVGYANILVPRVS